MISFAAVHFKNKAEQRPLTIKYIDPTYMVRAVPANAFDSVYCTLLAQHAVHAAMAGYTRFTVGRVDMRYVLLPIEATRLATLCSLRVLVILWQGS